MESPNSTPRFTRMIGKYSILIVLAIVLPNVASRYYTQYTTARELAQNPTPPRFEDVNGDGIQDKIIRKQVYNGMPIERYTLEDEVLFGVNINGKIAYVPKEVYEKLQGYVAPNK